MKSTVLVIMAILFINPVAVSAGLVVTDADTGWATEVLRQIDTPPAPVDTGTSPVTLAILDFKNNSGKPQLDALEKGLSILLEHDLAALEAVNVVERTKLLALRQQMQTATPDMNSATVIAKVGRLTGAHYVSWGTIQEGQVTEIKIDPRLGKVANGVILEQPAVMGDLANISQIHKGLLFDIIRILEIDLTPAEKASVEKPSFTDSAALMTFFAGVEASDKGDYRTAANRYAEALVKDPQLDLARRAIEELEILGLPQKDATGQAVAGASKDATGTGEKAEKSSGTAVAIGAGVALAAGGAILIASAASGSGGGGGGGTPVEPEPDDTEEPLVTRTTPRPGQVIMCAGGNIEFHFTEPMNTSYDDVAVDQVEWNITSERWADNDTTLIVDWDNSADPDYCENTPPEQVTYSLLGFEDKAGNPLQEETQFTYNVE
jgi:TolB-like protein